MVSLFVRDWGPGRRPLNCLGFMSCPLNCFGELNLKEMRSLRHWATGMPPSELLEPLGGLYVPRCELPELSGVCVQV